MLLHEKMRLQRKINRLTLKQLHFGNITERMQKKVDKREKYYAKLEKQLERQANAYKNYATNNANSIFTMGVDPNSIYSGQMGMNGAQQQALMMASKGLSEGAKQALDVLMQSSFAFNKSETEKDAAGNPMWVSEAAGVKVSQADYQAAYNATRLVQQYQSQIAQQVQNFKTCYAEQVDNWFEAMKDQLDGQREWEMDLLAEEQADMEAEKESIDAQLQLAQERKKNIESMLQQSIQDAAPKFGLG